MISNAISIFVIPIICSFERRSLAAKTSRYLRSNGQMRVADNVENYRHRDNYMVAAGRFIIQCSYCSVKNERDGAHALHARCKMV